MKSSKDKETLEIKEHLDRIGNLLDLHIARVESIYDKIDEIASDHTVTIKGNKYIRVSRFRFEVRHERKSLLNELRSFRQKWKELQQQEKSCQKKK